LGYCNVAEVIKCGANIKEYKTGDRILSFKSHTSSFVIQNNDILAKLTEKVTSEDAVCSYLYHLGYNSIIKTKICAGMPVVIIGLGVLGLTTLIMSKLSGAKVHGITNVEESKNKCKDLGVSNIYKRSESNLLQDKLGARGADVVIVTTNSWSDWDLALEIAGRNSKIGVLGFPGRGDDLPKNNPLNSEYFYYKQLQIIALGISPEKLDSRGYLKYNESCNLKYLLGEIENKNLTPNKIISGIINWEEIENAYDKIIRRVDSSLTYILKW